MCGKLKLRLGSILLLLIIHKSLATVERLNKNSLIEAVEKQVQEYESNMQQLKNDAEKLMREKELAFQKLTEDTDVIDLNVGGELITTTRESLTRIPTSTLAKLFKSRWQQELSNDYEGNIYLDFDPILFRYFLNQLRSLTSSQSIRFPSPSSSSPLVIRSFKKMLRSLGFDLNQPMANKTMLVNVGGDRIITRENTLTSLGSSSLISVASKNNSENLLEESRVFLDADPWLFRNLLRRLREQKGLDHLYFHTLSPENTKAMNWMLKSFGLNPITTTTEKTTVTTSMMLVKKRRKKPTSPYPARWKADAITVAGGRGAGKKTDQLSSPYDLCLDDRQKMYVADRWNHRIVAWNVNGTAIEVVAGGQGPGKGLNQFDQPNNLIMDQESESLLICDYGNRRVMRWPRFRPPIPGYGFQGEVVIDNIDCRGLALDEQGSLYISDCKKHEVRRYDERNGKNSTVVAGGHGIGKGLNQLNYPSHLFVDEHSTLYVSDTDNHRVIKWPKGAKEGIVVAGGNGPGADLNQLSHPKGLSIDGHGHVFVVDESNHRVMRWEQGAKQGVVVVGGKGKGAALNQLLFPQGLFFDLQHQLYIADRDNHRVQRFSPQ